MRTKLIQSNKPEYYIHNIRNVDTSPAALTIPTGTPLVLNLSNIPQPPQHTNGLPAGWEDGLQVVLPSTAGATNTTLFYYGISTGPIILQQLGETMVHGVAMAAYVKATRASTTASWASSASSPGFGQAVAVNTASNVLVAGATANAIGTLIDDFPAAIGSAAMPGDTRTVVTQLLRTFVRQM